MEVSHSKPARAQRSQPAYRLNFQYRGRSCFWGTNYRIRYHTPQTLLLYEPPKAPAKEEMTLSRRAGTVYQVAVPNQQQNATTEDMLNSPYMDNRSPIPYSVCIPFKVRGTPTSLLHKHRAFSTSTSGTAEKGALFST